MPGNPKFDPLYLVKIVPKLEKSTHHSHKLTSSENGQDTSAYKISGYSLHAFSGKCPETSPDGRTDRRTDGRTDGHAVKRLRLVGWTNGPMYRSKDGISGFGRMDGRTDGQTDGPTKRCLVATFVHKFGCLFPVWLLCFVWLRLYVQTHKTVSCGYFCP